MKKKTPKKTPKKTVSKEVQKKFLGNKKAITLLGPGKFKFCVARVIDSKKYETVAKFSSVLDAAKFCDLLNK